ncbi:MAG: hypothetical protein Q7S10_00615 [bacterium]|nr:hypothetical protein [bacterium]
MQNKVIHLAILIGAVVVLGFSGAGFANAAPPTIGGLSHTTKQQYDPAFTLTVTGAGFVTGTKIQATATNSTNGQFFDLLTNGTGATTRTTSVPASALLMAGSKSVRVINPNGEASDSLAFEITALPAPTISGILRGGTAVTQTPAGTFAITINGTNFIQASVINVSGTNRPTTFVSSTQLTSGPITWTPGDKTIKVRNPMPSGDSGAAILTITANAQANADGTTPIDTAINVDMTPPAETALTTTDPCLFALDYAGCAAMAETATTTNPLAASVTSTNIASLIASVLGGFIFKAIFGAH